MLRKEMNAPPYTSIAHPELKTYGTIPTHNIDDAGLAAVTSAAARRE